MITCTSSAQLRLRACDWRTWTRPDTAPDLRKWTSVDRLPVVAWAMGHGRASIDHTVPTPAPRALATMDRDASMITIPMGQ